MYKHIISYRHYTSPNSKNGYSPMKQIEVVINEQIYKDGPGVWKTKCQNFISSQTGINPSQVLVDDGTLSIECLGKVKEAIEEKHTSKESQEEIERRNNDRIAADRARREAIIEEARLQHEREDLERARAEEEARKKKEEIARKRQEAIDNNPLIGKFKKYESAFANLREKQADLAHQEELKFKSNEEQLKRIKWLDNNREFYTSMSDDPDW
jgi:hypothetical protein